MKRTTIFTTVGCSFIFMSVSSQTSHTGMRGISGIEVTSDMAPGLNLFNTLDAYCGPSQGLESETCWGNPKTTVEMVAAFKERGFRTLRIPTTWYNHMGPAPDYTINSVWMDRVEEVANYAFDNNMYVILNIHHEDYDVTKPGSWLCPTYARQDAVTDQLEKVWTQIATRFKDYGDYLIFETMNEPREVGSPEEWTGGTAEHRDVVNAFNLAAVNAIRGTGGNNATRFIMIPQVDANPEAAISDLVIPHNDTNIIVSLHNYNPYAFCLQQPGVSIWGSDYEISVLQNEIKSYSDYFVNNGQAVVIGEWGAADKDNLADRITYYEVFANACKEGQITPVNWIYDFNRITLSWENSTLEDAILNVFIVFVEDLTLNFTEDTLYVGDILQLTATIAPENATPQLIIWTSDNKEAAIVSSTGLVTAKATGLASVTAKVLAKTAECKIVVIDTLTSKTETAIENILEVYPNPVSDKLNLKLSGFPLQIELYALDGKRLFQLNTNDSQVQIDMASFKSGIYLLKIASASQIHMKKIVFE